MRIAILHFHLNTGGVTTVIEQQARVLTQAGHDVLLLSGEIPRKTMPAPVTVIPGLAYDNIKNTSLTPDEIASDIFKALHDKWNDNKPDIIHIHNPTLAKNRRLLSVVKHLHQSGFSLLCQIHDFAEDGRSNVYYRENYVADCHYAVVNERDRSVLLQAGLRQTGVHHLPNAITAMPVIAEGSDRRDASVLYPVRAIRRKNIGEAVLLHLFAKEPVRLMITQPPNSERDMASYALWRNVCARHDLPVVFDAGKKYNFQRLVAQCRYVLTTSITEGFGFTFLEAWTAGKALWGRLLPDICADFTARGVRLDHLYRKIDIPMQILDAERLKKVWTQCFWDAAVDFGYSVSESHILSGWEKITQNDVIDFGLLDELSQHTVIEKILRSTSVRDRIAALNPFLETPGPPNDARLLIRSNRSAVEHLFSLAGYRHRLIEIYNKILTHPVKQAIDKSVLLDFFMTPDRFALLKWSTFNESGTAQNLN